MPKRDLKLQSDFIKKVFIRTPMEGCFCLYNFLVKYSFYSIINRKINKEIVLVLDQLQEK